MSRVSVVRDGVRTDRGNRSDSGFTLLEMVVACALLSVVIGTALGVVTTFDNQEASVQATLTSTNQVMLASEVIGEYIHDAVATCASGQAGCSATSGEDAFSAATGTSATFYTDTTGSSGPPSEVTLSVSAAGTLTATVVAADANSCPMFGSTGTGCTFNGTPRTFVTVTGITDLAPGPFSYVMATGGGCPGTSAPASSQYGKIVGMCIDLETRTGRGQPAGYQSLAYLLAPNYNEMVG